MLFPGLLHRSEKWAAIGHCLVQKKRKEIIAQIIVFTDVLSGPFLTVWPEYMSETIEAVHQIHELEALPEPLTDGA